MRLPHMPAAPHQSDPHDRPRHANRATPTRSTQLSEHASWAAVAEHASRDRTCPDLGSHDAISHRPHLGREPHLPSSRSCDGMPTGQHQPNPRNPPDTLTQPFQPNSRDYPDTPTRPHQTESTQPAPTRQPGHATNQARATTPARHQATPTGPTQPTPQANPAAPAKFVWLARQRATSGRIRATGRCSSRAVPATSA